MNDLVGIIRIRAEVEKALPSSRSSRSGPSPAPTGDRKFNPGWHLALDLRNMLAVCESTAGQL